MTLVSRDVASPDAINCLSRTASYPVVFLFLWRGGISSKRAYRRLLSSDFHVSFSDFVGREEFS